MSAKRLLLCTAIGMVLLAGGLTAFSYGLAQVIETGSCGTDEYGRSVGPPCPAGTGWMIMAMVGGVFVALAGAFVFAARGGGVGLLLLIVGSLCVAVSAAVLGIVDVHASDTRPGREVMWIAGGCAALVALVGGGRGRRDAAPREPSAPARERMHDLAASLRQVAARRERPDDAPADRSARAEDIAARLRQLDQLRQSGLLPEDDYAERRRQILAEL
jgi:hypothetical protein